MISSRILAMLVFCFPCWSAHAANLIVIEARGIAMQAGQVVDSGKPLALKLGQHIMLLTPAGVTLKIDGPYDKAPDADQSRGVSVTAMMAALATQRQARTGEVGTTRGFGPGTLPEPWVFDASRTGTVCLSEGTAPVFWRPDASRDSKLAIMPADRSWKAEAEWPAGSDRITVSTPVTIHPAATYLVALDGIESAMNIVSVPAVLTEDVMQTAWMANKGCEAQAEALQRQQK